MYIVYTLKADIDLLIAERLNYIVNIPIIPIYSSNIAYIM